MTYSQEKHQSIETNPEMVQMLYYQTDFKAAFINKFKDIK